MYIPSVYFSLTKTEDAATMIIENTLKNSIKEMMVENLMLRTPKDEITDEILLFGPGGLGLDSIDALELVVSLEKQFGVTVPNSEVARSALVSVNTIHDYVLQHANYACVVSGSTLDGVN